MINVFLVKSQMASDYSLSLIYWPLVMSVVCYKVSRGSVRIVRHLRELFLSIKQQTI